MYFMVMLTSQNYCEEAFLGHKHNEALDKLGMLNNDECYGFQIPLSEGGNETIENIIKADAHMHLSKLAKQFRAIKT